VCALNLPGGGAVVAIGAPEPSPATIAAWQQYERLIDARYDRLATGGEPLFVQDVYAKPGWRQQATSGHVSMFKIDSAAPGGPEPSVPDGKVHHWVGGVFIANGVLDHVLNYLRDRAGRESESYDDVVASKLVSRDGDRVRIYMKLRRDSVITVTYNTEHTVVYRRLGTNRASSRSVATKIAELADVGTPQEREKPPASDHGFLWRLNAYWRFEQIERGVLVECESVSLSRGVPMLLRPFVTGTVERIARESLLKTLTSLRAELLRAAGKPKSESSI
jgi:hypothetical protein